MKRDTATVILEMKPLPGSPNVPDRDLARLLKRLLRAYFYRLMTIAERKDGLATIRCGECGAVIQTTREGKP